MRPLIEAFHDHHTGTISYVVHAGPGSDCAIIDPVLDYDPGSGCTHTHHADRILAFVQQQALKVVWLLETHAHADHLSSAPYLQDKFGGRIAIGEDIRKVQKVFQRLFAMEPSFLPDGTQFDHLFSEGEIFAIGELRGRAISVPGHTPADMAYLIGDALFVGDTWFMPDAGTARCDFPGGDAATLYASIQKLLALPDDTRVFVCHDYAPNGRAPAWETTIGVQRTSNIHVAEKILCEEFVRMRTGRDATLDMPQLMLPSIQVNIRAGHLPPPSKDGRCYLCIPLNAWPPEN